MKRISPYSSLVVLLMGCFTLATLFVPRALWWNSVPSAADWNKGLSQSENVFKLLFGEGRQLFANEFFTMGDVYFHSGFYPSIFDQQELDRDVADPAHGQADDADPNEDFRGNSKDWIDQLDRNFVPNRHTHLSVGGPSGHMKATSVQEILPWMRLAADMNPQMIETYTVAAYWLGSKLNEPKEAEAFLQEGLHNNPHSYELLFDLGWLYEKNYHDTNRAENVWLAGLREWNEQSEDAKTNAASLLVCDEITGNLGHAEEDAGHLTQAIHYLEIEKMVSTTPDAVQHLIDEARQKLAAQSSATNAPAH